MNIISWDTNDFGAFRFQTLHETPNTKEIQVVLPRDSATKENSASVGISMQVLSGRIWLKSKQKTITLDTREMVTIDAKTPYSLGAYENSVLRLSLSKTKNASLFERVLKITRCKN